jgi:hypothetical protein
MALLATCSITFGQVKTATPRDSLLVGPQLRSVLLDVYWVLFIGGISAEVDIDFLQFRTQPLSTLGVRLGLDHYASGGPGGPTGGSPFTDYDLLLRHTVSGSLVRFDLCVGYCYYTTSSPKYYPAKDGWKFGVEIRFKVIEHFLSALGKFSRSGGIGGSIGWDR